MFRISCFEVFPIGELLAALTAAERAAVGEGMRGKDLTPFLLGRLADITDGQTLKANHALGIANAQLAAQIAQTYAQCGAVGTMKAMFE